MGLFIFISSSDIRVDGLSRPTDFLMIISPMRKLKHSAAVIESSVEIHREEEHGLKVVCAMYRLADGRVEFGI